MIIASRLRSAVFRELLLFLTVMLSCLGMERAAHAQALPYPGTPTNLLATYSVINNANVGVRLTWTDNATDEQGFQLVYLGTGASNPQVLGYFGADTTVASFTLPGNALPVGTAFNLYVRSLKGTYDSENATFTSFTSWSAWSNLSTFNWPSTSSGLVFNSANDKPTGLAFSIVNTNVPRLTWVDHTNAEYFFELQARDTNGGVGFQTFATPDFNVTQFDFENYLLPGHTYEIKIRAASIAEAVTSGGSSPYYTDFSNTVTATIPGTLSSPPTAPSNLTVSARKDGSYNGFTVAWDDNASNESHFEIQAKRSTDPDVDASYNTIAFWGAESGVPQGIGTVVQSSQQDTGNYVGKFVFNPSGTNEMSSESWTFRVRAVKGFANSFAETSAFCPAQTATIAAFNAPTNLTLLSPNDDGKVQLLWNDNATTEIGYVLEDRLGNSGTFFSEGTLDSPTYSRFQANGGLTGYPPSSVINVQVKAYNGTSPNFNFTAYSNVASITTQPLTAPSNVQISQITKSGAHITWQDNSLNETNYQILYKVTGASSFSVLKSGLPKSTPGANNVATSGGTLSTDVTGLAPGVGYDIAVRAYYDFNDGFTNPIVSVNSNVASFFTKDGITNKSYAPITLGVAFSYPTPISSHSPRVSWSVTGLPAGLAFNDTTGEISGTPTVGGVFNVSRSVTFQDGTVDTDTLVLRIGRTPGAPSSTTIPDQTLGLAGSFNISLSDKFSDADSDSAVRLSTTLGNIDLIMFDTLTPLTVANFVNYVNNGHYTSSAYHRSVAGFVLQGGGLKPVSSPDRFSKYTGLTPVQNEPGISNLTGTVAMAKLGTDPNSATDEYFFNLGDNSSNLDNQNGGFTVFARVSSPTMAVVNSIVALPSSPYGHYVNDVLQSADSNFPWPMNVPVGQSAPSSMNISNVVKVDSAAQIPVLTFAVTNNSSPAVVTASINGSNVVLTPVSLGTSTVTVQATDLDGNASPTQSFTVTVIPPSTDANLSSITISAGMLSPAFASGTTSYNAGNVPFSTSSVTVTPTVTDSTATVKVNNVTVASGAASGAINLNVGSNTITTVVTAQDGTTTKTYTIDISRDQNPAEIAVEQPAGTNLTDNSGINSFGTVVLGSAAVVQTFTIKNLGSATLSGLAVTQDGTDASLYTVNTAGMTTSVAPAGSTTFTVTFAPTTSGTKTAALHITSNDADENPFDIALTGTCTTPKSEMTSPTAGTTFTSTSATFNWSAGTGVASRALWIGSSVGASDIYSGNEGVNLTKTVTTLPDDGRTLYVRLYSLISGAYQYLDYQYTAYRAPTPVKAQITVPANGSTLTSTSLDLTWNAGTGVTTKVLWVGTTAGGYDLYSGVEAGSSKTVTVPATGAKIHVTLWSLIKGAYQANYYVFITAAPVKAALTTPASNGSTLTDGNLNLIWSPGTGVSKYYLFVGSAEGKSDIASYDAGTTTNKTFTVPTDGGPVYVTLWSLINGAYQSNSYWFTTALPGSGPRAAILTSHANGSTFSTTSVNLAWDQGTSVTKYVLWVGSTPDGYDLYAADEGTGVSRSVTVPGDGRRIYVTLHSLISGAYQSNSYFFTATTSAPAQAAQLISPSPANGTTLSSTTLNLAWDNGTSASQFALWVGNSPQGYDIYAGSEGTNHAKTISSLPSDGRPIYVTLWSLINGSYQSSSYWFITQNTATTTNKARMTTPSTNASNLTGSTYNGAQTFNWDAGLGVTSYALWIGSSPNSYDLYSGVEVTTSKTVNLPTDGRKLHVTLWSLISGAYQKNCYYYTAPVVSTGKAAVTAPTNLSTLTGTTLNLNWSAGSGVTGYALWVGRKPGGYEVYSGVETGSQKQVAVPADGGPIYVTLWSLINGSYQSNEYIYQAANPPP